MTQKKPLGGSKIIFLLMLPGLIWYVCIVFLPFLSALRLSLFSWSGGVGNMKYIGLKNYSILLADDVFWQAFKNNVTITVLCVIGQIGLAFFFAVLLSSRFIRFKRFTRIVSYFPATVASVVVGYVWSIVFNYNYGIINSLLRLAGLSSLVSPWLDNPKTIILIASIPIIWQYIGYYMVIILAGITSIDQDVYDMAEIDGANEIQKAIKITFPLIRSTIAVCIMLCISGNMKIFDHIYSLTGGGPGNSSMVMALYVYKTTFIKSQFGYASAMSVGIMVLSLAFVMLGRLVARAGRKE
jgi:raffinose/stachyose/melibiose transport system permease protein